MSLACFVWLAVCKFPSNENTECFCYVCLGGLDQSWLLEGGIGELEMKLQFVRAIDRNTHLSGSGFEAIDNRERRTCCGLIM